VLQDKVPTDLERSEILVPDRDEGEERDHQSVAIPNGFTSADGSARFLFTLVHQLLTKVEQLKTGNDRPQWGMGGGCGKEARLDSFEPSPVAFRHHDPSGRVKRIYIARDRLRRAGLSQMGHQCPNPLAGQTLDWSDCQ
jgi:hypothetical protein